MDESRVVPVSEARARLAALIDEAESGRPALLASRSRLRAILLGIDTYKALTSQVKALEAQVELLRLIRRL